MTKEIYLEILLEVDITVNKATHGYRNSMGVPEEPDEDASVDINSIKYNGKVIELHPDDLKKVEEKIEEAVEDDGDPGD